MGMVDEHPQVHTLKEIVITPAHADRTESPEFRKSVQRLKDDGHYKCWLSGRTDNLQVHHVFAEWSLQSVVDYDKLKSMCEEWDPYGYGRLMKNIPMTTVDDVRNMLVLNQEFHTGVDSADGGTGIGIHEITFPVWIIQKVCQEGKNPVPQANESLEKVEDREK
jgi:hypothetical protein